MKKLLTTLMLIAISFGTITASYASPFQTKPAAAQATKKDGTPDKRFKGNKAAKGPVKKDGTADKRFKANKPAPAPKKTTTPKKG